MVEGEEGGILLEHGHTVSAGLRVQLFVDVPEIQRFCMLLSNVVDPNDSDPDPTSFCIKIIRYN
jgi:hypothetical protein